MLEKTFDYEFIFFLINLRIEFNQISDHITRINRDMWNNKEIELFEFEFIYRQMALFYLKTNIFIDCLSPNNNEKIMSMKNIETIIDINLQELNTVQKNEFRKESDPLIDHYSLLQANRYKYLPIIYFEESSGYQSLFQ